MTKDISRRDVFRFAAVGLGGLAIAGTVAGCSSDGNGASAGRSPTAGKATDFSFASWGMSEAATKPTLGAAVDSFGQKKGVTVKTPSYDYNDYLNQLTLQVRGGQFAGAAQLDVAWASGFAALGKLRDLSGLATGRGYTEAALKAGQVDGKQIGLPWTIAAIGLITNSELLQKAGITTPATTIDAFEDQLRSLKALGGGLIPYAASTKAAQLKDILVWMQTFGSPLIDGKKCTIGDAASVKAVTWYKKLYDDGLIAPDVDRAAARTLFAQGKTAIYDDAPVGKAGVVASSPDKNLADKMSSMARPVLTKGDTPVEVLWGHLVTVVDGDGADTAGQFAQWLTSDTTQTLDYFSKLGLPPTTKAALGSSEIEKDTFISDFSKRVTVNAAAEPLWKFPQYAQMETEIANQVQAVLIGSASPKDAMKQAGQAVQQLMSA
ncbi:extracellular solute-binding protein [Planctomonas sp. JC2975]|uniref:sugar ABC transporter substrate-binding protein n=1 Tax=Planctomonas sp. JC2975 TaxID=2729626 RepID=UPI001475980F|nr:extracellular solute-binding protein [Planctomonas sp. JC2975]NNC13706.1 extracellular solute-binding protein [Planctomonas sp. JC2975]